MKRTAVLAIALLLLGGAALPAAAPVVAQTGGPGPAPWYVVEQGPALSAVEGASSGGSYSPASPGYQLTSLAWHVSGTIGGGAYRLTGPDRPALRGNGCCCTFLPLMLRSY